MKEYEEFYEEEKQGDSEIWQEEIVVGEVAPQTVSTPLEFQVGSELVR